MNNSTLKKIALPIVEKVAADCPWLDSDGLSNIMHAYLDRHQLPMVHHRGVIQPRGFYSVGHDWLTLGCWTIDYHSYVLYPWEEVPRGNVPGFGIPFHDLYSPAIGCCLPAPSRQGLGATPRAAGLESLFRILPAPI